MGPLPEIPLFSELGEEALANVVSGLNLLAFHMGDMICEEGGEGDSIYIIAKGRVKVFIRGVAGEKIEITRLGEGDFFGEVGFFSDARRHASVMAVDDVNLLEVRKKELLELEEKHPHIKEVLEDFYKKRVLDKLLVTSPLFGTLDDKDRQELLESFNLRSFNEGDVVIKEGEDGDSLFIVKSGRVKVSTVQAGWDKVPLGELKAGDFFGEVAVITGKPRTATVKALTPLELMELSRDDLMATFNKYPRVKEVLDRYLNARAEKTISTIMALKAIESKEGLV